MSGIAPLVLFDLDGTLVDSAVDLLNALNVILVREGRAPVTLAQLRPVVSKGGRAMLGVGFPDLPADQRERHLQPFLDVYADALAHHSTPFDGIAQVLSAIEAAGSRWGIVTNKPVYLAEGVVATMGWSQRCAAGCRRRASPCRPWTLRAAVAPVSPAPAPRGPGSRSAH